MLMIMEHCILGNRKDGEIDNKPISVEVYIEFLKQNGCFSQYYSFPLLQGEWVEEVQNVNL